jgi:outer membrane protein assembly factor BamB
MKTSGQLRERFWTGFGALVISIACCSVQAADAENWTQFRGPTGLGLATDKNLPVQWGGKEGKNVLWKSPLVGKGHASPIVWGDRVFVCTARWDESVKDRKKVIPEQHVLCYRVSDGKLLWDRKVPPGKWLRDDFRSGPGGGYAAPTPATDGKLVYCVFGSSVIAALDFDGKIIWRKDIVPHTFDVTIGGSPILYRDTVILLCAMAVRKDSRIVAFSKADGSLDWEKNIAPTAFAHSTPVIIRVGKQDQMIVVASGGGDGSHGIQSFDPAGGKRLWWCKGEGDASSAAYGSGIVYADNGRGGKGLAVAVDGKNHVTKTHVKWIGPRIGESIGSPIIVGEYVYRLTNNRRVRCWGLKDGKEAYSEKLEGLSTTWASPVADADGRIYFASTGKSYVIQSGPKFKILGASDLGDSNHASPAIANGKIFLVGMKNVYCIAAANSTTPKPKASGSKKLAGKWACISDGVLAGLAKSGVKIAWPGKTAGIVTDRATGNVHRVIKGYN